MNPAETTDGIPPAIDYELLDAANPSVIAAGIVGLKLIAFWKLFGSIAYVPLIIDAFLQRDLFSRSSPFNTFAAFSSLGLQGLLALTVLFATRRIAVFLFGGVRTTAIEIGAVGWMTLIISGVGLLAAFLSIDDAVNAATMLVARINFNVRTTAAAPMNAADLTRMVLPIVKLLIGLMLFLRPRLFVEQWAKRARL